MRRRLRARFVFAAPGRVLAPGEVLLDGGSIVDVRHCRGRVPDVALLPGLVDAHAHLQLTALAAAPRAFVPWVGAVMAQRGGGAATAAAMLQRLAAGGCTAVGEIDSTGQGGDALRSAGFAGRCYRELTGFHLGAAGARRLVAERRQGGSRACPAGLSPHAPYSVSPALLRAAARASRHLQVHCAETEEEVRFLRDGDGPFRELLEALGRLPAGFRPPRTTAVRWLARGGALRRGTVLVHCQHLQFGDAERIAAAGAAIAVCPGTIAFFGRRAPPVADWLRLGIRVGIGTDSHASNDAFSMLAELRRAARLWPGLAPEQLLAMATVHGAAALGRPRLGRIAEGSRADLFAVQCGAGRPQQLLEQLLHGERAPSAVWLAGREVAGSAGSSAC